MRTHTHTYTVVWFLKLKKLKRKNILYLLREHLLVKLLHDLNFNETSVVEIKINNLFFISNGNTWFLQPLHYECTACTASNGQSTNTGTQIKAEKCNFKKTTRVE